jgi:hypothetical protein
MTGPKFFEFYGPEGLIVQGYLNPVCYGIPTEAGTCTTLSFLT